MTIENYCIRMMNFDNLTVSSDTFALQRRMPYICYSILNTRNNDFYNDRYTELKQSDSAFLRVYFRLEEITTVLNYFRSLSMR